MTMTATRIRYSAREMIDEFLDPGTFRSWDGLLAKVPTTPEYKEALNQARAKTGLDESVITGRGRLRGREVAVVAGEFSFLGGSIGTAAAERLTQAIERATRDGCRCWPRPSPAVPGCRRARSPSCR